jgi:hypothetical protein
VAALLKLGSPLTSARRLSMASHIIEAFAPRFFARRTSFTRKSRAQYRYYYYADGTYTTYGISLRTVRKLLAHLPLTIQLINELSTAFQYANINMWYDARYMPRRFHKGNRRLYAKLDKLAKYHLNEPAMQHMVLKYYIGHKSMHPYLPVFFLNHNCGYLDITYDSSGEPVYKKTSLGHLIASHYGNYDTLDTLKYIPETRFNTFVPDLYAQFGADMFCVPYYWLERYNQATYVRYKTQFDTHYQYYVPTQFIADIKTSNQALYERIMADLKDTHPMIWINVTYNMINDTSCTFIINYYSDDDSDDSDDDSDDHCYSPSLIEYNCRLLFDLNALGFGQDIDYKYFDFRRFMTHIPTKFKNAFYIAACGTYCPDALVSRIKPGRSGSTFWSCWFSQQCYKYINYAMLSIGNRTLESLISVGLSCLICVDALYEEFESEHHSKYSHFDPEIRLHTAPLWPTRSSQLHHTCILYTVVYNALDAQYYNASATYIAAIAHCIRKYANHKNATMLTYFIHKWCANYNMPYVPPDYLARAKQRYLCELEHAPPCPYFPGGFQYQLASTDFDIRYSAMVSAFS